MSVKVLKQRKGGVPAKNIRLKTLMMKYNSRCCYCDREVHYSKSPYATIEHMKAKSSGGSDYHDNLKLSCHSCNFMKSNSKEEEFLIELKSVAKAVIEKEKKMENIKHEAYMYGAQMGAEYLKEIGKTDLAKLTGDEVLTFSECMCKNYHLKYVELTSKLSHMK